MLNAWSVSWLIHFVLFLLIPWMVCFLCETHVLTHLPLLASHFLCYSYACRSVLISKKIVLFLDPWKTLSFLDVKWSPKTISSTEQLVMKAETVSSYLMFFVKLPTARVSLEKIVIIFFSRENGFVAYLFWTAYFRVMDIKIRKCLVRSCGIHLLKLEIKKGTAIYF